MPAPLFTSPCGEVAPQARVGVTASAARNHGDSLLSSPAFRAQVQVPEKQTVPGPPNGATSPLSPAGRGIRRPGERNASRWPQSGEGEDRCAKAPSPPRLRSAPSPTRGEVKAEVLPLHLPLEGRSRRRRGWGSPLQNRGDSLLFPPTFRGRVQAAEKQTVPGPPNGATSPLSPAGRGIRRPGERNASRWPQSGEGEDRCAKAPSPPRLRSAPSPTRGEVEEEARLPFQPPP